MQLSIKLVLIFQLTFSPVLTWAGKDSNTLEDRKVKLEKMLANLQEREEKLIEICYDEKNKTIKSEVLTFENYSVNCLVETQRLRDNHEDLKKEFDSIAKQDPTFKMEASLECEDCSANPERAVAKLKLDSEEILNAAGQERAPMCKPQDVKPLSSCLDGKCLISGALVNSLGMFSVLPDSVRENFKSKLSKSFSPSVAKCVTDNTVPSCMKDLISGVLKNLWENAKGIWELMKMPIEWAWNKTHPAENKSSEAMHAAASAQPGFIERFNQSMKQLPNVGKAAEGVGNLFKEMGSSFAGFIESSIKETFGCEKWSGSPYVSKCLVPMQAWDCASCSQKMGAICGVVGFAAGEIVTSFLTGGAIGAIRGVAVTSRFGKATASLAKASGGWIAEKAAAVAKTKAGATVVRASKATGQVISDVAGGVVTVGKAGKTAVTVSLSKIAAGLEKIGVSPLMRAAFNGVKPGINKIEDLLKVPVKAVVVTTKTVGWPITAYFKALLKADEIGFRMVDRAISSRVVAPTVAAIKAGQVDLKTASKWSETERQMAAKQLVPDAFEKNAAKKMDAILEAHKVGEAEGRGMQGVAKYEYSAGDIAKKARILKDAGFLKEEREILLRSGVAGGEGDARIAAAQAATQNRPKFVEAEWIDRASAIDPKTVSVSNSSIAKSLNAEQTQIVDGLLLEFQNGKLAPKALYGALEKVENKFSKSAYETATKFIVSKSREITDHVVLGPQVAGRPSVRKLTSQWDDIAADVEETIQSVVTNPSSPKTAQDAVHLTRRYLEGDLDGKETLNLLSYMRSRSVANDSTEHLFNVQANRLEKMIEIAESRYSKLEAPAVLPKAESPSAAIVQEVAPASNVESKLVKASDQASVSSPALPQQTVSSRFKPPKERELSDLNLLVKALEAPNVSKPSSLPGYDFIRKYPDHPIIDQLFAGHPLATQRIERLRLRFKGNYTDTYIGWIEEFADSMKKTGNVPPLNNFSLKEKSEFYKSLFNSKGKDAEHFEAFLKKNPEALAVWNSKSGPVRDIVEREIQAQKNKVAIEQFGYVDGPRDFGELSDYFKNHDRIPDEGSELFAKLQQLEKKTGMEDRLLTDAAKSKLGLNVKEVLAKHSKSLEDMGPSFATGVEMESAKLPISQRARFNKFIDQNLDRLTAGQIENIRNGKFFGYTNKFSADDLERAMTEIAQGRHWRSNADDIFIVKMPELVSSLKRNYGVNPLAYQNEKAELVNFIKGRMFNKADSAAAVASIPSDLSPVSSLRKLQRPIAELEAVSSLSPEMDSVRKVINALEGNLNLTPQALRELAIESAVDAEFALKASRKFDFKQLELEISRKLESYLKVNPQHTKLVAEAGLIDQMAVKSIASAPRIPIKNLGPEGIFANSKLEAAVEYAKLYGDPTAAKTRSPLAYVLSNDIFDSARRVAINHRPTDLIAHRLITNRTSTIADEIPIHANFDGSYAELFQEVIKANPQYARLYETAPKSVSATHAENVYNLFLKKGYVATPMQDARVKALTNANALMARNDLKKRMLEIGLKVEDQMLLKQGKIAVQRTDAQISELVDLVFDPNGLEKRTSASSASVSASASAGTRSSPRTKAIPEDVNKGVVELIDERARFNFSEHKDSYVDAVGRVRTTGTNQSVIADYEVYNRFLKTTEENRFVQLTRLMERVGGSKLTKAMVDTLRADLAGVNGLQIKSKLVGYLAEFPDRANMLSKVYGEDVIDRLMPKVTAKSSNLEKYGRLAEVMKTSPDATSIIPRGRSPYTAYANNVLWYMQEFKRYPKSTSLSPTAKQIADQLELLMVAESNPIARYERERVRKLLAQAADLPYLEPSVKPKFSVSTDGNAISNMREMLKNDPSLGVVFKGENITQDQKIANAFLADFVKHGRFPNYKESLLVDGNTVHFDTFRRSYMVRPDGREFYQEVLVPMYDRASRLRNEALVRNAGITEPELVEKLVEFSQQAERTYVGKAKALSDAKYVQEELIRAGVIKKFDEIQVNNVMNLPFSSYTKSSISANDKLILVAQQARVDFLKKFGRVPNVNAASLEERELARKISVVLSSRNSGNLYNNETLRRVLALTRDELQAVNDKIADISYRLRGYPPEVLKQASERIKSPVQHPVAKALDVDGGISPAVQSDLEVKWNSFISGQKMGDETFQVITKEERTRELLRADAFMQSAEELEAEMQKILQQRTQSSMQDAISGKTVAAPVVGKELEAKQILAPVDVQEKIVTAEIKTAPQLRRSDIAKRWNDLKSKPNKQLSAAKRESMAISGDPELDKSLQQVFSHFVENGFVKKSDVVSVNKRLKEIESRSKSTGTFVDIDELNEARTAKDLVFQRVNELARNLYARPLFNQTKKEVASSGSDLASAVGKEKELENHLFQTQYLESALEDARPISLDSVEKRLRSQTTGDSGEAILSEAAKISKELKLSEKGISDFAKLVSQMLREKGAYQKEEAIYNKLAAHADYLTPELLDKGMAEIATSAKSNLISEGAHKGSYTRFVTEHFEDRGALPPRVVMKSAEKNSREVVVEFEKKAYRDMVKSKTKSPELFKSLLVRLNRLSDANASGTTIKALDSLKTVEPWTLAFEIRQFSSSHYRLFGCYDGKRYVIRVLEDIDEGISYNKKIPGLCKN